MRFNFQAVSKVRTKARSPSTTIFTGVPTGVPSRRYVVSKTVLWFTNWLKAPGIS